MANKLLVLITGANQGIGYFAAQQLLASGSYHVLLGTRDLAKGEEAVRSIQQDNSVGEHSSSIEPLQIDMGSDESITAAAKAVQDKYNRLDVLMLNAGIAYAPGSTREHYQQLYNVNVFGPAVTVDAFLPLLRRSTLSGGKRIAFTSTGFASIKWALEKEGFSAENFPIYRSSKTAVNMIMAHYTKLLESEGFIVSAGDPGYCATNLNAHSGYKHPSEGAKAVVRAVTASKDDVHGLVVDKNESIPW